MLILDTDHLSEFQRGTTAEALRLQQRLAGATEPYGVTIISVEEVMRGWMAAIRRVPDPRRQVRAYEQFQRLFQFFATWNVVPWNDAAAATFDSLRRAKVRVGTMDLKIASICLVHQATLLTRNRRDFSVVPGLVFDDWLS
jgi:tRNA(fMet)-specific endonuclease VapC